MVFISVILLYFLQLMQIFKKKKFDLVFNLYIMKHYYFNAAEFSRSW